MLYKKPRIVYQSCCMRRRRLGSGIALISVLSGLSCASGPKTLVGYKVPQRQQVAIVIEISDQVNEADQGGGVATLADTVSDRLKEAGIDSQLYTSKYDHPHAPRIDLYVRHWQGPSKSSRNAAKVATLVPAAGIYSLATWVPNNIVVDCSVTLSDEGHPVFEKRFEKTPLFGTGDANEANAAAESAGNAIVSAILTR